jgi:hypothetical protein
LVLFLNLIWEGTCIGFFIDLLLQCQVPRTTTCLLSHLSHPISRHLIFAHEFKVFVKTTSVFEKFQGFLFWRSRPEYPPTWAKYPGGRIFRAHYGQNIRLGRAGYIKGGDGGQFFSPTTRVPQPPPPTHRRRRSSSRSPGLSSSVLGLLLLGRVFTKPFVLWMWVSLSSPIPRV